MSTPLGRRVFLGGTVAALGTTAAIAANTIHGSKSRQSENAPAAGRQLGYELEWLGVNGWKIAFDDVRLLIDPWVTRYFTGTFSPGGQDPDTEIVWNRTIIDDKFSRPVDMVLLTHGHFDHISDVPLIAANTGATVWGTESHLNLVRSLAARTGTALDENKLSLLRGGELRDLGAFTITVLRSVHRPFGKNQIAPVAQSSWQVDPSIRSIKELGEGGSLNYVISNSGASTLMVLGSGDFSVSDLPITCPDAVILPTGGANVAQMVQRFVERVGRPRIVIASHWDNFDLPLNPPVDVGNVPALKAAVADAMPDTRFVIPVPGSPITL